MSNFRYFDEVKGTKKKQITIALEERLVDELEEMATEMDIPRNQLINDGVNLFIKDYHKYNSINYYIINSNNRYMPEGHLHMLNGNRASAWEDTKTAIEGIKPGDYVFIYYNEHGIVGSGRVISEPFENNYSLVHYFDENTQKEEYTVWEEIFVQIEYEKKALTPKKKINSKRALLYTDFKDIISGKPLGRTKINLTLEEGEKLKEAFLNRK